MRIIHIYIHIYKGRNNALSTRLILCFLIGHELSSMIMLQNRLRDHPCVQGRILPIKYNVVWLASTGANVVYKMTRTYIYFLAHLSRSCLRRFDIIDANKRGH